MASTGPRIGSRKMAATTRLEPQCVRCFITCIQKQFHSSQMMCMHCDIPHVFIGRILSSHPMFLSPLILISCSDMATSWTFAVLSSTLNWHSEDQLQIFSKVYGVFCGLEGSTSVLQPCAVGYQGDKFTWGV